MQFTKQQIQRYERIRVLEQMQKMDPIDFEHYCAWLYQKEGYRVEETVTSGDEGVDLLLTKPNRRKADSTFPQTKFINHIWKLDSQYTDNVLT